MEVWEIMGIYGKVFRSLKPTHNSSPKNDRIFIVSTTLSLWQKIYGKTRPHCHNSKGVFLGESSPLP